MAETVLKCFRFIPDGTDELLIDTNARRYWGSRIWTKDATPVFAKIYDTNAAAAETDTPVDVVASPANATAVLGAGNNGMLPAPIPLTNGLSIRAVVGLADNDDTALTTAENQISVYYE